MPCAIDEFFARLWVPFFVVPSTRALCLVSVFITQQDDLWFPKTLLVGIDVSPFAAHGATTLYPRHAIHRATIARCCSMPTAAPWTPPLAAPHAARCPTSLPRRPTA